MSGSVVDVQAEDSFEGFGFKYVSFFGIVDRTQGPSKAWTEHRTVEGNWGFSGQERASHLGFIPSFLTVESAWKASACQLDSDLNSPRVKRNRE